MKEINFTLKKCKTKAAYSAKLKNQKLRLNLEQIKKSFDVLMDTKILLVLKIKNVEIVCHKYGELLFKKCDDVEKMNSIAKEVYSVGLESALSTRVFMSGSH